MLLDARYKNPTNKGLIIWGAGILFLTCKELAGQDWGTDWLRDALGTQALFCALLS